MDITTLLKLQEYITDEMNDAQTFAELSKYAPSEDSKKILLDLASDASRYANLFLSIYRDTLSRDFVPTLNPVDVNADNYRETLRAQTLKEIGDYRKYEREFATEINSQDSNVRLQDAYMQTRAGSNALALSLLYLLEETDNRAGT